MSVAFGFLDSFPALAISRFLQGIAGAAVWTAAMVWLLETAPAARRGELLGFAFGVSEAGAIAGPAAGGVASAIGRGALFAVIAGACALLAVAALRAPAPPRTPNEGGLPLRRMLASARVRTAMWIAFLPAVVLAAISVLGPLQQHHLGAGAGEIAATFAVAAMLGIIVRPWFGRLSDRRGPMRPIRLGLLASAPIVFLLPWVHSRWPVAALIVGALVLTGILWAPLMLMLSDACTAAGVSQIMAVAIMDLTWPPGNAIGSTGGAAIAQIAGTRWAYGAIALALLAGWAALLRTSPGSGERDLAPRPVPVGPA
jgi:predicted MFS family arabinose efflux permease